MKYWFIFFVNFLTYAEPQIVVPHLSNQTLEKISLFDRQHPTGNYSIYVQREYGWWTTAKSFASFSPSNNSLWSWVKPFAGATTLGYMVIFYSVCKTYGLAKKICSWASWLTNEDDELCEQIYRTRFCIIQGNRQRYQELMKEYDQMKNYIYIDGLLRSHGLRSFFPYDKELDMKIKQTVVSLEKIMEDTEVLQCVAGSFC